MRSTFNLSLYSMPFPDIKECATQNKMAGASNLPVVIDADVCTQENASLHHTDRYIYVNNSSHLLVVRRGEPFKIKIMLDKKLDRRKFNLLLVFETGRWPLVAFSSISVALNVFRPPFQGRIHC